MLLVERAGEPLKGWWSIPGGLLETGEKLEDAVRRETLEETGLRVEIAYRFDIFERIMRDSAGRPVTRTAGHLVAKPSAGAFGSHPDDQRESRPLFSQRPIRSTAACVSAREHA